MLRGAIIAASVLTIAVIIIGSRPVEAGSCQAVVAEGRGANEAKASARAQKHLTFKINRWASKNGYAAVRVGKSKSLCSEKGAIYHCIASSQVCG